MIDRAAMCVAVRIAIALSCCLAAGCAGVGRTQTTEPVPAARTTAPVAVAEAPAEIVQGAVAARAVAQAPDTQRTGTQPAQAPSQAPSSPAAIENAPPVKPARAPQTAVPKAAAPVVPATPAVPLGRPTASAAPVPVKPAPAPQVVPQQLPKVAAAPAVSQPTAAPLDLNLLETRLRETKAIGVFTKLSLKNQVDDLLGRFRAYHKRQGTVTIVELRRNYDMLLLKVLALLQDSDPSLARDIVRSRAAIWSILSDPQKFTESNLMAGATP
jgi:hypothetical protein